MDYFEIIRMILLVIIMSAAVVDDCRRYRISNRIIICGFIAAVGVFLTEQIMKGGAMQYLTACIAGLGVMSAIYIVKGAGAGDVKLSAVCGMLLGIKDIFYEIKCAQSDYNSDCLVALHVTPAHPFLPDLCTVTSILFRSL